MKIAVLVSSYERSDSCLKDFDPILNPAYHYPPGIHDFVVVPILKTTAPKQICQLARSKQFDVFVNLCDGAWDEDRAGLEVVEYLEHFNVPYTGAKPAYYNATKEHMKMVAHSCGIKCPCHKFAYDDEDIEAADKMLTYPMIVKPFNGYSSVGMTSNSKVTNSTELFIEARRIIAEFGGALVEEYIDGREFTVLVVETTDPKVPVALLPMECSILTEDGFKHFDVKMITWEKDLRWEPVTDEELSNRLKDMSIGIFLGMKGNSYGRCDIRMDSKTNELYFLEINANCTMFCPKGEFGSADIILTADTLVGYKGFTDAILEAALRDYRKRQKKYKIDYSKTAGFGMKAVVDISPGELILEFEAKDQPIVSLSYAAREWDSQHKQWIGQYGWPLSDNVYGIWSEEPSRWKQMNHSCDPNMWLDGLNVVARLPIRRGENLTIDYATFCAELMQPFECNCGSRNCRREIKPTDFLQPFIGDMYGEHISDYIRMKRLSLKTSGLNVKNGYSH